MTTFAERWDKRIAPSLHAWWAKHGVTLMRLAVALMIFVALVWLAYEFWRLLLQPAPMGAIDLRFYHDWVRRWFVGKSVHTGKAGAEYPPASFAILWPLVGWLSLTPARWLWAATTMVALGSLAYLIRRACGANTRLEQAFVALMPFSMYATGATIGNGQLIVHVLPALVGGLLLLDRRRREWRRDLLGAALVVVALVKPTISIPFLWIVIFVPGRLRPALLVGLGYVTVTLFAASFQEVGLLALFRDSLAYGWALAVKSGHANLHSWLATLGLEKWILSASSLVLAALGLWTYSHRHADLWLLIGVAALAARFWTYHAWYDDLLILLPMVALFRIAKRGPSSDGTAILAGVLLAITLPAMIVPGGLYLFPPPWNNLYVTWQVTVWGASLIFLIACARREQNTSVSGLEQVASDLPVKPQGVRQF